MSYLGSWKLEDLLTFTIVTTRVDTGNATDADSVPLYHVYENETATPLITGTMSLLNSANTAGFYSEQITLAAGSGFEKGKSYNIYIQATVNSIVGATTRNFQLEAEVDSNAVSDKTGYSLSSPQNFNLIGNISGTWVGNQTGVFLGNQIGNIQGSVNAVQGGFVSVSGTVVSSVVQGGTVTVSGTVVVGTNNDKTGYSLSSPQNFNLIGNISGTHVGNQIGNIQGSVANVTGSVGGVTGLTPSLLDVAVSSRMASGTVVVATVNDKTGYSLSSPQSFTLIGNISGTHVGNQIGNIQGSVANVTGSVGGVTGLTPSLLDVAVSSRMASGTVTVGTNNDKTGYGLNTGTLIQAIVNQVWDEQNGLHLITGSTGKSLSNASSAGDPWSTNIPGAYTAGQAGFIVGGNLDAKVSSRMISGSVTVGINNDKTGYLLSGTSTDPWLTALPGAYGAGTAGKILGTNLDVLVSSRMASGTVTVGTNNDKTGFSLSTPQSFNLIGNISGTLVGNIVGNIQGSVANVTGSVGGVTGLTPSLLDVAVSSRMASGTVVVGTNNDKTNYSLANNQVVNFSGTITNVFNVLNPVTAIQITGSVNVIGLNPAYLDTYVSSRMASGTVTVGTNNDKTGYGLSTGTLLSAIADAVWDEQIGGHLVTGSTGKSLSSASSAGDPWTTPIPGAYGAGTAGYIIGTNVDTPISSRLSSGTFASNYVVPPTAAANATAVLSAATANPIDANVQEVNDVTIIGDGSVTPWGP